MAVNHVFVPESFAVQQGVSYEEGTSNELAVTYSAYEQSVGEYELVQVLYMKFVTQAGANLYDNAQVLPGMTILGQWEISYNGLNNWLTLRMHGTPTTAGTFNVYLKAFCVGVTGYDEFGDPIEEFFETTKTIPIAVSGVATSISPASGAILTSGGQNASATNDFVSREFVISHGSGSYRVTASTSGFWPLGLNDSPEMPSEWTGSQNILYLSSGTDQASFYFVLQQNTVAPNTTNVSIEVYDQVTGISYNFNAYTLTVEGAGGGGSLTITQTPSTVNSFDCTTSKTITFSATGGTGNYSWAHIAGTLPAGTTPGVPGGPPGGVAFAQVGNEYVLTFNPPYGVGNFSSTVQATEIGGTGLTATKTFSVIIDWDLSLFPLTLPNGTVGTNYTTSVVLTGSWNSPIVSYEWSLTNAPPGLGITGTGATAVITGTPSLAGNYTPTSVCRITKAGGASLTLQQIQAITIAPGTVAALPVNHGTIPTFTQGTAITPIVFTSSSGTLVWTQPSGTLPAGLTLTQDGQTYVLSGTPTGYTSSSGVSIGIQVTRPSDGAVGGKTITLTVNPDYWPSTYSFGTHPKDVPLDTQIQLYGCDITGGKVPSIGFAGWPLGLTPSVTLLGGGTTAAVKVTGTPIQGGTFTSAAVVLTTTLTGRGNATFSKTIWYNITITGNAVTVTPINTTLCVSGTAGETIQSALRARVTGGVTNRYNVTALTPDSSVWSVGPFESDNNCGVIVLVPPSGSTVYTFTLTSVDDPGVTATATVTASVGDVYAITYTPPQGTASLHAGETLPLTSTKSVPGCATVDGYWTATPSLGSFSPPSGVGKNITYVAPATISTTTLVTLSYWSFEGREQGSYSDGGTNVTLLPGTASALQITTASIPNGTVGTPYPSTQLAYSGVTGVPTWSMTGAPAGLAIGASTGIISGTPTGNGSFNIVINLSVQPAGAGAPSTATKTYTGVTFTGGADVSITGVSPNEGPVGGGTFVTVTGTGFTAGDQIQLEGYYATVGGDPPIQNYNATIVNPTTATFTTTAWSWPSTSYNCSANLRRGGVVITTRPNSWLWRNPGGTLAFSSFSPSFVTAGTLTNLTITCQGQGFDGGTVVQYKASGGSWTSIATSFVSSSQLNATIPYSNFANVYAGTKGDLRVFRASDNAYAQCTLQFSINRVAVSVATTQGQIPIGTRSQSFPTFSFAAANGIGPFTWGYSGSIAVPLGLTLNANGSVTGTVSASAVSTSPTIKVTDTSDNSFAVKPFDFVINGGAFGITTLSIPDAENGVAYNFSMSASGGLTPYTWALTGGSWPSGMTLSSAGVITGTPNGTPDSNWTVTITATDSTAPANTNSKSFTFALKPAKSVVTIGTITPDSGPIGGGTSVTIEGTGFLNGCGVKFGNSPATNVTYINGSKITCFTPAAAAGAVSVTVTNPDLGNGSKSNGFTYRTIVAPVISSIDKQDGPFEGGQIVTLYGSNFDGVSVVKFGLENTAVYPDAIIKSRLLSSSPQTITVQTPAYTLTDRSSRVDVNIYVTNTQGVGTLSAGDLGYTFRPPPIITQVIPSSGATTGGNTIYVIGKNFFERGSNKPRVFIGNVEVNPNDVVLKEE